VKVSFNSALAQKEAAKKEEENGQVLILPPDAKVGIGAPSRWGWPGSAAAGARLGAAEAGGGRAGDGFILFKLLVVVSPVPPRR